MTALSPTTTAELGALLRDRGDRQVRLLGAGTRQEQLPAAPSAALQVSLARLDRIQRLEPDDLTCSVEPGVRCADLQRELHARGVDLGIDGDGTIGGCFAADPVTDAGPGAPSPRSTLLGCEAVLADGTSFKSGARVVKSVAGFDVHKLLVGSRGRLFAATLLHLKLRPRAQAAVAFASDAVEPDAALAQFVALRRLAPAPTRLVLMVDARGARVGGRIDGRANWVADTLRTLGLRTGELPLPSRAPEHGRERLAGLVLPSRLPELLALLPRAADLRVGGAGRFTLDLPGADVDALLPRLPALGIAAAITHGARERRGLGTPRDPAALALEAGLMRALDPQGVLA